MTALLVVAQSDWVAQGVPQLDRLVPQRGRLAFKHAISGYVSGMARFRPQQGPGAARTSVNLRCRR